MPAAPGASSHAAPDACSRLATRPAAGQGASVPPRGRRRTTSGTGRRAERPTCPTCSCSAVIITGWSTKRAGVSRSLRKDAWSRSHPRRSSFHSRSTQRNSTLRLAHPMSSTPPDGGSLHNAPHELDTLESAPLESSSDGDAHQDRLLGLVISALARQVLSREDALAAALRLLCQPLRHRRVEQLLLSPTANRPIYGVGRPGAGGFSLRRQGEPVRQPYQAAG